MTNTIAEVKALLRKEYLFRRAKMGGLGKLRADNLLAGFAAMLLAQLRAPAMTLYASDGTEPELLPLLATEVPAYLPRYNPESGEYEWVRIHSLDELEIGKYKIREPLKSLPAVSTLPERTLFFVPLVAFDQAGHRLGRGKGFYDRLLKAAPEGSFFAGAAYSSQECSDIPVEVHDIKLDAVVTETGTLKIK